MREGLEAELEEVRDRCQALEDDNASVRDALETQRDKVRAYTQVIQTSLSLKYEPSSEPMHISMK